MFHKFLLLLLSWNFLLIAEDENKNIYWAQVGTGISFMKLSNSDAGMNFLFSLNYEFQNNNINFSYMHSGAFELFNHPGEYIKSYAIKYGRSYDFKMRGLLFPFPPLLLILKKDFDYSLIVRTGISYNIGLKRTTLIKYDFLESTYNSELLKGFGVPIEVEIREELSSYFGMSVLLFADLNKVSNYWGFSFSIQVGSF